MLLVEGIQVDDGAISSAERADTPLLVVGLPEDGDFRHRRLVLPAVTIDAPGAHRVRLVCWQVFGPVALTSQPIVWNEGGTPALDPTVIDARRVEVELEITIEP